MKIIGTLAVLGATVALSGWAQQTAPPTDAPQATQESGTIVPRIPEARLQRLTKRLNLTAEQQEQVRPILTDSSQQMQAIRSDSSLTRKDRRQRLKGLREDTTAKLESVFTPDQKQGFENMQKQMQERRHHGQSAGHKAKRRTTLSVIEPEREQSSPPALFCAAP